MSVDAFPAHESTRKRRRWGCTCGCVAVLIVLAIGGTVLLYSLLRPTPIFPKPVMFDAAINGFGVLRIDSTDEGEADLIKFVFHRAERAQLAGLSESDAKLMSTLLKIARQFISTLVQTESPVYLSYDSDTQRESVVSVIPLRNKLSYLLLKKFLTSHVSQPQDHKGDSDIYPLEKLTGSTTTSVMAVSQAEFVYSDDLAMLNRSLDYRPNTSRNAEPDAKLQERMDELSLDKPPAGEDLVLLFANEPGRLENLFRKSEAAIGLPGVTKGLQAALAGQKLSLNDILAMKFSGDLVSADRAKIELTFYFRQPDHSAKFAAAAKQVLPAISGKHEGTPFEFRQDVRTRGTPVVISIDMTGIRKWLESIMPAPEEPQKPAAPKEKSPAKETAPAE